MHDSPREVLAHGENWLEALREGRRQLGEDAGLPPGASCVMAPNGEVTLLDGGQRRRYVLTPLAAQAAPSAPTGPAQAAPPAPTNPAQSNGKHAAAQLSPAERSTVHNSAPQDSPHVSPQIGSATNGAPSPGLPKQAESAALAVGPTLPAPPLTPRAPVSTANPAAPAPVVASGATSAGRARQTVEFSPERAQALQREFETARARSLPAPEVASPTELPKLPHPNLRAITANNVRASSLPPPSAPSSSLPPPPAAALRSVAARTASGEQRKSRPLGSSLYGVRDDGLSLLHARDLDPTDESPLTYRERAYLLGGKADRVRLEVLLQAELACIRRELSGFPRGQFVRLGLFTEAFDGAPNSPPIATLEWKDWRGRAQFQLAPDAKGEPQAASSSASTVEVSSQEDVAPSLPTPSLAAQRSASRLSQPALAPSDSVAGPEGASNAALASAAIPSPAIPSPAIPSAAIASTEFDDEFGHGEPDLRLASAFEAMPELYLLPTPVAGLEFTIQLLARLLPCEAMSCCLYDINTDEFRFVALSGLGALDRKASAIRANAGLFGAARLQVLIVPDVSQDARYRPAVDGRSAIETKSLAYAPLRYNNQLLGMVQLINRTSHAGFSSADVSVLSYVAEQLGEFLANCRALIG